MRYSQVPGGPKILPWLLLIAAVAPWLATSVAVAEAVVTDAAAPTSVEIGRRMYMDGRLASGELMSGTVVGDVKLSGEQVVCAACHRRSGLGSTEGQEAVPAVTGDLLYAPLRLPTSKPPLAPTLRPAYDDASLKRAIRDGIRSDGTALGDLMPRYDLTDDQLDSLVAYLKQMESNPAPGVTDQEIHFATIIAGAVDPQTRKAFLDVLQTYFEQKNRESRHETDRSAHAPWHKAWVMKPYRKWVLHLWELEGPRESWPAQLQERYREQPVFAVISGLATGSWEPIHGFCESVRVPCIFPNTDLPVVNEADFYSVYFTRGMALEADAVAQHLADSGLRTEPLAQVYDTTDPRAVEAASRLRERWVRFGGRVDDFPVTAPGSLTEAQWQALVHDAGREPVVAWLGHEQLDGLWRVWASDTDQGPARVILSTSLFGSRPQSVPAALRDRVYLVHPRELPSRLPRLLARSRGWLKAKGIWSPEAEEVQANAFFALKVAGEAAKRMRGFFNREYFLEGIEHMAENATFTSVYPGVSLAPGQRFISRGAYIAQFPATGSDDLAAVGAWIVPGTD